MASDQKFCEECHKVMRVEEFYGSNNLEKYPDGKFNRCKKCLTKRVDNWDPETFLWILQEADVPYIPDQWNKLLENYAQDRSKVTGMTIIGRYLGKMRMKQFSKWRWKDSEFLQQLADHEKEETMKRQGYDMQEITTVLNENRVIIPKEEIPVPPPSGPIDTSNHMYNGEDYFGDRESEADDSDITNDLTEEDRTYLRLKWGKAYKPTEWVQLEQLYQEMCQSYDIQSAGDINSLKLACKTSLKSNQLLDIGDVDGAQKMLKMYDGLMKSGKWTAAQNKAEKGEFLDSISEFVLLCEKEGFIPRFYTDQPNDRVDETIKDLQGYTHSLVVEEMNLGNLIENAVKEMALQEAKEEDEDVEDELDIEEIEELKDEDFSEFTDFVEEESEADQELLHLLSSEEEEGNK